MLVSDVHRPGSPRLWVWATVPPGPNFETSEPRLDFSGATTIWGTSGHMSISFEAAKRL